MQEHTDCHMQELKESYTQHTDCHMHMQELKAARSCSVLVGPAWKSESEIEIGVMKKFSSSWCHNFWSDDEKKNRKSADRDKNLGPQKKS